MVPHTVCWDTMSDCLANYQHIFSFLWSLSLALIYLFIVCPSLFYRVSLSPFLLFSFTVWPAAAVAAENILADPAPYLLPVAVHLHHSLIGSILWSIVCPSWWWHVCTVVQREKGQRQSRANCVEVSRASFVSLCVCAMSWRSARVHRRHSSILSRDQCGSVSATALWWSIAGTPSFTSDTAVHFGHLGTTTTTAAASARTVNWRTSTINWQGGSIKR